MAGGEAERGKKNVDANIAGKPRLYASIILVALVAQL